MNPAPNQKTCTSLRYSLATFLNWLLPAWLFRYRRVVIHEMLPVDVKSGFEGQQIKVSWCHSKEEFESAESVADFCRDHLDDETRSSLMACLAVAEEDEARLGAGWVATDTFFEPELGLRYELGASQAWLFTARVIKKARRRGIYTQMLSFLSQQLEGIGLDQVLVAVDPHDKASNHIHQKHSKRELGEIIVWRCLAVSYCRTKGSVFCNHKFSFEPRSEPITVIIETPTVKAPHFVTQVETASETASESQLMDSVEF